MRPVGRDSPDGRNAYLVGEETITAFAIAGQPGP